MYIVLCGMMGAGKSTVGGALARLAQTTWLDTDALIEEKYGKITDIFAEHGEGYFRREEWRRFHISVEFLFEIGLCRESEVQTVSRNLAE